MHGQGWNNDPKPATVALTLAVLMVLAIFGFLLLAKCVEMIGGRM